MWRWAFFEIMPMEVKHMHENNSNCEIAFQPYIYIYIYIYNNIYKLWLQFFKTLVCFHPKTLI
jgi:hypothetical protein